VIETAVTLRLCPCRVVLDDGVVEADGLTCELLADPERLRQHCLELPYGFTGVDRR
jgi:cobalt/nickel transport system ATP-binding protein